MKPQEAYDDLTKRMKEIAVLGSISGIIGWEENTYMPSGSANLRSEQKALLAGMIHSKSTDPKINELLATIEASDLVKDPNSIEAANIRELRHAYDKAVKLPESLVVELTKARTFANQEWMTARKENDFKKFQPWLDKLCTLSKQKAEAYGYKGHIYNALLDDYEPGCTVDDIKAVFANLRDELVNLVEKIQASKNKPDSSIVQRDYDVAVQRYVGEMVAAAIGFDFNVGRLDITTHPFCMGVGPGDTRITTRYNPKRFNDAFFGTMHETGHALYEMGIDKEKHWGMPLGDAVSLGIHESQSRMWENQVGRSKAFWNYFYPIVQRLFRDSLGNVPMEEFYRAINIVEPSFIRVEADEVTYNLHILLRFEIEMALLDGDIKAADVPDEWNKRVKKYLGIKVENDTKGCLQDVHWSAALIGYFPTYTLGNLYAAQFWGTINKQIPDLAEQFKLGNFMVLRNWLKENIHVHGMRYRATDLVKKVTGQPLSHKPMMEYLNKKFSEVYKL